MSRSTLAGALAELNALLVTTGTTPAASLSSAGVTLVLGREPGAEGVPSGCTVTLDVSGMDPAEWALRIRIYVTDNPTGSVQALRISSMTAVDALVRSGQGFHLARWETGWAPELGCWLAAADVMVGREDYF